MDALIWTPDCVRKLTNETYKIRGIKLGVRDREGRGGHPKMTFTVLVFEEFSLTLPCSCWSSTQPHVCIRWFKPTHTHTQDGATCPSYVVYRGPPGIGWHQGQGTMRKLGEVHRFINAKSSHNIGTVHSAEPVKMTVIFWLSTNEIEAHIGGRNPCSGQLFVLWQTISDRVIWREVIMWENVGWEEYVWGGCHPKTALTVLVLL